MCADRRRRGDTCRKLDAELIHRVLLTDQENFSSLRFSSVLPEGNETPTFRQFQLSLEVKNEGEGEGETDADEESSPANTTAVVANFMKAAFRDLVVERANSGTLQPVTDLCLELHRSIRQLIPSRMDLHTMLDDSSVAGVESLQELVPLLIQAANAIEQLEAPVRSETTRSWISEASHTDPSDLSLDFIVNSIMYLLFKAELCDSDKRDFYLSTVWAPMIHERGVQLTQDAFERDYGSLSSSATAPLTRTWLKDLASQQPNETSGTDAKHLMFRGWLDILLGEGAASGLPEIFALDGPRLESIRQVTRVAAAGAAIVLHARQVVGATQSLPSEMPESTLRTLMLELNKNYFPNETKPEYTQRVVHFVTMLVREWNPSLDSGSLEQVQHRTMKVLRGEDEVIQVYVRRIKECFWEIILQTMQAPMTLRTGVVPAATRTKTQSVHFQETFDRRGLSLFASDLAEAAWMAFKIVDLAWKSYGSILVEPVVSISRQSASIAS